MGVGGELQGGKAVSMSDTAEYWFGRRPNPRPAKRRQVPPHDCKPRGGSPGTHNRWKCAVCGRRFASKKEVQS
jgi:hypothetical protein